MKYLIVAHYKENLDWLKDVPEDWEQFVVTKDKDYPNQGRECASFLWAIQQLYDKLTNDDELIFVQGNPFDHYPDLLGRFSKPVYGFEGLGPEGFKCGEDGRPHHFGLPIKESYEKWFQKHWPEEVTFYPGGQFAVRGKRIKRLPKNYYKFLEAEVCIDQGPWVMERLWPCLFAV